MAPVPEPGGGGVLRVTPDELRDGARAFDAADTEGGQLLNKVGGLLQL